MTHGQPTLEEAFALVLRLPPKERLRLVEWVVSSVEREIEPDTTPIMIDENWGQNLVHLLQELDPIELDHPEIEDPTEWVKQIRKEQNQKRLGDWGDC